jgi:5-oxoprolinase (ATP-hydrolysing) subunit A
LSEPAPARLTDLNADLGESFGAWKLGDDAGLMEVITSANIACGFHAGDPLTLRSACAMAASRGVCIGAQVSYRDLAGFGRREMDVPADELTAELLYQIAALDGIARAEGSSVRYVKPHGALYHRCQRDAAVADALVRVAARHEVGVLGQPDFEIVAAARRAAVPAYREGFADRLMLPDGSLAPRNQAGALLNPMLAAQQAVSLARSGRYDTICIHADTPGAGQVASAVRGALHEAGIETAPLAP